MTDSTDSTGSVIANADVNITNLGGVSKVRSMNLPEIRQTLIFEPLTNSEKEMLAKKLKAAG